MAKRKSKNGNVELLDDIGVEYDPVHISVDENAIFDYEEDNEGSCFLVDWRCEFDELLRDINDRLTDRQVEYAEVPKGYKVAFQCGSKKASTRTFCRVEMLKAIDRILGSGAEQMRVLADSLCGDTVCIMIKPADWWKTMEKHFKSEMKKTYIKLKDVNIV